MGVISGLLSNVNGATNVGKWNVSSSEDLATIVASNTKGGTVRLAGNDDWEGSYEGFGATPESMPGDALDFVGCIDATEGASGTAIVEEVEIKWDIEGAQPIKHTVKFAANGALTLGTVSQTADTSVPNKATSVGTKLESAEAIAIPVFAEILDIRTMTLTITSSNQSYVSSSTGNQTKREKGNFDFSFTWDRYVDDTALLAIVGVPLNLKVFTDATKFWDLKWARVSSVDNIEVDRETAALVSASQTAEMDGFVDIAGTVIEGAIKDPTPTTVWP